MSECDREASIIRRPWPTRGSSDMLGKICLMLIRSSIFLHFMFVSPSQVRIRAVLK